MILIAPDKFKGTISARRAAQIIAEELKDCPIVKAPMADGGEGTAQALCWGDGWQLRDGYYVNKRTRTAVIDSSSVIGLNCYPHVKDILHRSSAPLGTKVREIVKSGCDKVLIGVGGTGCCDGGVGFLEGLDKYMTYRDHLVGLCDVRVPLLPSVGFADDCDAEAYLSAPSALMFAPQKGASSVDLPVLYRRLQAAQKEYGRGRKSPYDGAGGGLGFAIATAIGAPCHSGAQYVLDHYDIRWDHLSFVITGEGKIDRQTSQGKVVDVVAQAAQAHGIPCIAIGGQVEPGFSSKMFSTVDCSQYYHNEPLTADVAERRLRAAARSIAMQLR